MGEDVVGAGVRAEPGMGGEIRPEEAPLSTGAGALIRRSTMSIMARAPISVGFVSKADTIRSRWESGTGKRASARGSRAGSGGGGDAARL